MKKTNNTFTGFNRHGNIFTPSTSDESVVKLRPAAYELSQNPNTGALIFEESSTNHDELVDLPNTRYDDVMKEIDTFLLDETKNKFKKYGYLYKRGILLEGPPGAGKTCIINRVASKVLSKNGLVLFGENPILIDFALKVIKELQPESTVLVVFEELDLLIKKFEGTLLNLLDGETQKDNTIYMAATNYIDKVPARIRRPGRFATVLHVGYPSADARLFYLKSKFQDSPINFEEWVNKTEGFSIDELKETALAVLCLDKSLDEVVERLRNNRAELLVDESGNKNMGRLSSREIAEEALHSLLNPIPLIARKSDLVDY